MGLFSQRGQRLAAWSLSALALAYAFMAGLRTIADFDVGWLLATGRYLVAQHAVPRSDLFSYTAYGTPWIYPPFGGALLYAAYAIGGFAALSWINALACAAVVAIAVGRPRILTVALAIFAVPSIALRTAPRAELFTTLFFAAYLSLLWRRRADTEAGEKPRLWLLPLMMLVWVNVHPGFALGMALLAFYLLAALVDLCFASPRTESIRAQSIRRPRRVTPWILLSFLATLINPWGLRVYAGLLAQNKLTQLHSALIGEWTGVRLTTAAFAGAFRLRDPNSSYWWLLIFACATALVALFRRQFASALLLAIAAYLSVEHLRVQALFAIVLIVVAGEVFRRPAIPAPSLYRLGYLSNRKPNIMRGARGAAAAASMVMVAALAFVHIADTISDRSYLANGELSSFGAGLSWWYPQGAAAFIESNALPPELFNDYGSGGYLTLRLGPKYRDFADGRAVPFSLDVLTMQSTLVATPPDSPLWAQQADRYGINTIILSLARSGGLESVPLRQYCDSRDWTPVYFDDVSIVLIRNRPEYQPQNGQRLERFAIDCATYQLAPPSAGSRTHWSAERERVALYNFYANAASIYYVLGRDNDSLSAIAHAESLFHDDAGLPLLTGQLFEANGKLADAEAQYRRSLRIRSTDTGWYLLAHLLLLQKNYPEAAAALQHSADLASSPADRYRLLGDVYLALNQPERALSAFDRAERFGKKLAPLPTYTSFSAKVAEGRGRAWLALHDARRATPFLEQSAQLAPQAERWNLLAACYSAQGRTADAEQARTRARQLSAPK